MNKHKLPSSQLGALAFVATVKGQPVTTQYAVVELASLIMSNHLNGEVNELYPQELQPRDRTQPESVKKVWKSSKGIALSWLSKSDSSASGSPITGESLIVESGNGRSMAIRKAYYDGQAENYRTRLEQASEQFGIESEVVQAMREPVLIRIRLTEMDAAQFARDSNHDNGESSQADKSIIVGMFESVGDDIESANTIAGVKAALFRHFPPTLNPNDLAVNAIESLAVNLADLLRPSFEQRNGAKFSENLRVATRNPPYNQITYRGYAAIEQRAAELVFNDENASGEWLQMIGATPRILEFNAIYDAFYGNDYNAALTSYNWKQENLGRFKSGQISAAMLNHFTDKKLTKTALNSFVNASIDAYAYGNNPISSLVAENQFIVDHLTASLDNPIEMNPEERFKVFESELVKIGILLPASEGKGYTLDKLASIMTDTMERSKVDALEAAIVSKMQEDNVSRSIAKKLVAERHERIYVQHISKDIHSHTREAFQRFVDTGELPLTAHVGLFAYEAMLNIEIDRKYNQALEPLYEYMDSVIDDYQIKGTEIKNVKPSAHEKLASMGLEFDTHVKPHIDSICALTSGTIPSIEFECGDTNPELKGRAYAVNDIISIGDKIKKSMIWHEYGHMVENNHPEIRSAALALIRSRYSTAVTSPKIAKLSKYHDWANANEYIVDNYKVEPYESKFYTPDGIADDDFSQVVSTELISKGFEWLSRKNTAYKLMVDKELFKIIMAGIALMKNKADE